MEMIYDTSPSSCFRQPLHLYSSSISLQQASRRPPESLLLVDHRVEPQPASEQMDSSAALGETVR